MSTVPPPFFGAPLSNADDIPPPSFGGRRSSAGSPFSGDFPISGVIPLPYFAGRPSNAGGILPSPFGGRRSNAGGPVSGEILVSSDISPPNFGGPRSNAAGDPFSGEVPPAYYGGSRSIFGDPFSGDISSGRRFNSGEVLPAYYGDRRSNVPVVDIYVSDPFLDHYYLSHFGGSRVAQSKLDWKETPTEHVFQMEVPGLSKEEVKVEVEKGKFLKVSGERKREAAESNDTWHAAERSSGVFVRRFKLYGNPKVEEIHAKMENGVLVVSVPKGIPDVKVVEISG